MELRHNPAKIEVRSQSDGTVGIKGLALRYDSDSRPFRDWWGDSWKERITAGAARSSVATNPDITVLGEHRDDHILGRTSGGTARVWEDESGVWYEVPKLPDTSYARDYAALLSDGIITGSSFAMTDIVDEWSVSAGLIVRTISQLTFLHASPVSNPAYLETESSLRSLSGQLGLDAVEVRSMPRAEVLRRLATPTVIDLGSKTADGVAAGVAKRSVFEARLRLSMLR